MKELLENRLGNVEGYALLSEMEIKITSARISYASLMQERVNQKENNAYEQTRQPPQVDVLGCNSIELGIGFNENSPHSEAKLQPEQVGTPLADQTPKFFPQVAGGTTVNQLAELNRRQQEVMQHALAEKQKEALHNRIMMASQNALQSNSPNRNAGSGNKRSTGD